MRFVQDWNLCDFTSPQVQVYGKYKQKIFLDFNALLKVEKHKMNVGSIKPFVPFYWRIIKYF